MGEMNPGRELDALIAEKVMGWEDNRPSGKASNRFPDMYGIMDFKDDGPVWVTDFPSYSTDIKDAWEVVQKMKDQDIQIHSTSSGYSVRFDISPNPTMSYADTAPHAICLAALKAVGHETI